MRRSSYCDERLAWEIASDSGERTPDWTLRRHRLTESTAGAWHLQTPRGPVLLERSPVDKRWVVAGAIFGDHGMVLEWTKGAMNGYRRYCRSLPASKSITNRRSLTSAEDLLDQMRIAGLRGARVKTRAELVSVVYAALGDQVAGPDHRR